MCSALLDAQFAGLSGGRDTCSTTSRDRCDGGFGGSPEKGLRLSLGQRQRLRKRTFSWTSENEVLPGLHAKGKEGHDTVAGSPATAPPWLATS